MTQGLGRHAARLLLASLMLVSVACETGDPLPSVNEAAESFLASWSAGDPAAMRASFDEASLAEWPESRLRALFDRIERQGALTDLEVELEGGPPSLPDETGCDEDGPPIKTSVSYSITFVSEAVPPARLGPGFLPMTFDCATRVWRAQWEQQLLWPGVRGAVGLQVERRWSVRGAIAANDGTRLAAHRPRPRSYPLGSVAGSYIGHIAPLTRKDLREREDLRELGYRVGDLVGASGLERHYDRHLAGTPTISLWAVDGSGSHLRKIASERGQPGRTLKTTLDPDVQRAAENAFGSTVGGAVVLDPSNGDVLAAVSSSPFDPNNYVGVPDVSPFNRGISGLYPPGSSLKVMTAATALEEKEVTPSTSLTGPKEYKGVRNFESGEFGTLDFATALQHSVNTAFAQIAEDLGARRLFRYANAFGFNREEAGLPAARSSYPFPEDDGDVMWGAIGQAQVLATPLQMATIAATIANDGRRMDPRVDRSTRPSGKRVVTRKVATTLTALMERVVQAGTGVAAQIGGVRVAGKTGTAEVDVEGERENHAWFIAFAPANDPEVAIAVVSEYGGVGGQVAAPLARSILTAVLPLL